MSQERQPRADVQRGSWEPLPLETIHQWIARVQSLSPADSEKFWTFAHKDMYLFRGEDSEFLKCYPCWRWVLRTYPDKKWAAAEGESLEAWRARLARDPRNELVFYEAMRSWLVAGLRASPFSHPEWM